MNITPIDNSVSMQGKGNPGRITRIIRRVEQKILDKLPNHTTKESPKSIENQDKVSHWFGHPMWNRGVMGATALLTQPAIDYYNHRVDEDTRTVSRNRTISKIVAGTLVGMFVVRGPIHRVVKKFANPFGTGKWDKILLPKIYLKKLTENKNALENYQASIAMALILGVNCITNFVLDAPLTIYFTNLLNKKSGIKLPEESGEIKKSAAMNNEDKKIKALEVKDA